MSDVTISEFWTHFTLRETEALFLKLLKLGGRRVTWLICHFLEFTIDVGKDNTRSLGELAASWDKVRLADCKRCYVFHVFKCNLYIFVQNTAFEMHFDLDWNNEIGGSHSGIAKESSGMLHRVDWYIFLEYNLPVDAAQCRRGLKSFNLKIFFIRNVCQNFLTSCSSRL